MKKIFAVLLMMVLLAPMVASAQNIPTECRVRVASFDIGDIHCTGPGGCIYASSTEPCAFCCTMGLIMWVTNLLFFVIMILVVIIVLYAAYLFLTSGGDPKKVETARNLLIYAAIGIAIAFLARAVPNLISGVLVSQAPPTP